MEGVLLSNVTVKCDRESWDSPLSSLCPTACRASAKICSTGNQSTQPTEIIGTYTLLTLSTVLHSLFYSDSIVMWPKAELFTKKKFQKCMTLPWSPLPLTWSITNYKGVYHMLNAIPDIMCALLNLLDVSVRSGPQVRGTPTSTAPCLQGCSHPCCSNFCSTSTRSFAQMRAFCCKNPIS